MTELAKDHPRVTFVKVSWFVRCMCLSLVQLLALCVLHREVGRRHCILANSSSWTMWNYFCSMVVVLCFLCGCKYCTPGCICWLWQELMVSFLRLFTANRWVWVGGSPNHSVMLDFQDMHALPGKKKASEEKINRARRVLSETKWNGWVGKRNLNRNRHCSYMLILASAKRAEMKFVNWASNLTCGAGFCRKEGRSWDTWEWGEEM